MRARRLGSRRTTLAAAVTILSVLAAGTAGNAGHGQGGSMIGHVMVPSQCRYDPLCGAWLQTCDPSLAPRDGLYSSVVNVNDVAGSTRTLKVTGTAYNTAARVNVRLHRGNCEQIPGAGTPPEGLPLNKNAQIRIPSAARWMVVTCYYAYSCQWKMS